MPATRTTSMERLPALFVSHGAPTYALEPALAGAQLNKLGRVLPRPSAVLGTFPPAAGGPGSGTVHAACDGAFRRHRAWRSVHGILCVRPGCATGSAAGRGG